MSADTTTLKSYVQAYAKLDDELKELNTKVYELRNQRREVEEKIIPLISNPELSHVNKIQLSEDNSFLKIQRPGAWNKGWSISKKDLGDSIRSYFSSTSNPIADDCYAYIIQCQSDKLTSTEFNFTRVKNT